MIVWLALIVGAVAGVLAARRRKGTAADQALYAVGFGVAFGLGALFLTYAIAAVY